MKKFLILVAFLGVACGQQSQSVKGEAEGTVTDPSSSKLAEQSENGHFLPADSSTLDALIGSGVKGESSVSKTAWSLSKKGESQAPTLNYGDKSFFIDGYLNILNVVDDQVFHYGKISLYANADKTVGLFISICSTLTSHNPCEKEVTRYNVSADVSADTELEEAAQPIEVMSNNTLDSLGIEN